MSSREIASKSETHLHDIASSDARRTQGFPGVAREEVGELSLGDVLYNKIELSDGNTLIVGVHWESDHMSGVGIVIPIFPEVEEAMVGMLMNYFEVLMDPTLLHEID